MARAQRGEIGDFAIGGLLARFNLSNSRNKLHKEVFYIVSKFEINWSSGRTHFALIDTKSLFLRRKDPVKSLSRSEFEKDLVSSYWYKEFEDDQKWVTLLSKVFRSFDSFRFRNTRACMRVHFFGDQDSCEGRKMRCSQTLSVWMMSCYDVYLRLDSIIGGKLGIHLESSIESSGSLIGLSGHRMGNRASEMGKQAPKWHVYVSIHMLEHFLALSTSMEVEDMGSAGVVEIKGTQASREDEPFQSWEARVDEEFTAAIAKNSNEALANCCILLQQDDKSSILNQYFPSLAATLSPLSIHQKTPSSPHSFASPSSGSEYIPTI
ncbi:hypothetical protein LguiA_029684 [Lonicera macranthoides]